MLLVSSEAGLHHRMGSLCDKLGYDITNDRDMMYTPNARRYYTITERCITHKYSSSMIALQC